MTVSDLLAKFDECPLEIVFFIASTRTPGKAKFYTDSPVFDTPIFAPDIYYSFLLEYGEKGVKNFLYLRETNTLQITIF